MPKLIIQLQNQEWVVDLKEGSNTLGRATQCAVPIKDPSLSRQHCDVQVVAGTSTLVDMGSMNGTLINGKRSSTHRLLPGDKITIGSAIIWYERKNVASEAKPPTGVVRAAPAPQQASTRSGSQVATRRTVAAVQATDAATPPAGTPRTPAPRRAPAAAPAEPVAGLEDYTFRVPAGRGWGKVVTGVAVVAAIGVAAFLARGFLAGGGGVAHVDKNNLITRDPSFTVSAGGKPDGWTLRAGTSDKVVSAAAVDATQGRNGGPCLVLEKSGAATDLALECVYAEDFALGNSGAVEAAAWTRFSGFGGQAAVKIDWLQRVRGPVVAEEYSDFVSKCEGWTPIRATFARPPGAAAFRVSLAAVGRGGRVFFDDVSAELRSGSGPSVPEKKLGPHRVAATRHGVLQLGLRGRLAILNVHARLESEKEGATSQAFAGDVAMSMQDDLVSFKGRMANPADLRDIEFEAVAAAAEGGTEVTWRFRGEALKQVDRVVLVLTLPRSARLTGLPEPPDQPTSRVSVSSDEGDLLLAFSEPARLRVRAVDGRVRLFQSFTVDPGAEEPVFGFKVRDPEAGGSSGDPVEAARKARQQRRYGEALAHLRGHVKGVKEAVLREKIEGDIRHLEESERRDWADVQSRAFQATISRRPEMVALAGDALDLFLKQWGPAGVESKAEALREEMKKELAAAPDSDAERARRILERARKLAEGGRKVLAQMLLQSLVALYPQSDAAAEAQQLLKTLGP